MPDQSISAEVTEEFPSCDICGGPTLVPGQGHDPNRCLSCENQRIALGEAFLAESGTTWLYDKGAFVLRTVRKNLGLSHA